MERETELQNRIRCELSKYGIVVRMNTGVFQTNDGRHVRTGIPGMPDLLFIGSGGRTVWIEVKKDKGRLSPEQMNFIETLRGMGHTAGVARSVKDALELIGRGGEIRSG
ncbi:MAG: VRR-NUC domain-containing protein [Oscillospiraceae bacterium]|nr:VRR-NUC domain-containing protein [Oscillospiraceae bacterium]